MQALNALNRNDPFVAEDCIVDPKKFTVVQKNYDIFSRISEPFDCLHDVLVHVLGYVCGSTTGCSHSSQLV